MQTVAELVEWARIRGACAEGLEWLGTLPREASAQVAWDQCPRGDWLLWWAGTAEVRRETLVLATCAVWRALVLPHLAGGEQRPLRCIETVEAWCRGKATLAEVVAVRRAADAAAAAYAAAYAADAAAYAYTARAVALQRAAEIIRENMPAAPIGAQED